MDFLKVSVIILYIVLTILSIKIHPHIHKPLVLEDADFKLTRISDTLTTETIPMVTATAPQKTVQLPVSTTQNTKTVEVKVTEPTSNKTVEVVQPQTEKTKKTIKIPKYAQTPQEEISVDISQKELLEQIIKIAQQELEEPKVVEKQPQPTQPTQPTTQKPQQVQQPTKTQTKMTEQEELIAWNKWRSNIHNQVMRDSGAGAAPLGSIFTFSFLVDKYGNVSNIKTTCSHSGCMEIARTSLKSAIANLHRKPILEFPKNTHRTSVVVNGSFLIGVEDRFSTPSHFPDIERVVH